MRFQQVRPATLTNSDSSFERCWECGKTDHLRRDCPQLRKPPTGLSQQGMVYASESA